MRLYKIAQQKTIDPESTKEVLDALGKINLATATINASIKEIEQSGAFDLFQKDTLIQAIQSGEIASLDPTKIQQALDAMGKISQSSLVLNNAMLVIKNNPQTANAINMDFSSIQNLIISSLQSGDYSQFQSSMANFQSSLSGLSGTTGLNL